MALQTRELTLPVMYSYVVMFTCSHVHAVPYRDSVLTMLLKNALDGNSKTIMVSLRLGVREYEHIGDHSSVFTLCCVSALFAHPSRHALKSPIAFRAIC